MNWGGCNKYLTRIGYKLNLTHRWSIRGESIGKTLMPSLYTCATSSSEDGTTELWFYICITGINRIHNHLMDSLEVYQIVSDVTSNEFIVFSIEGSWYPVDSLSRDLNTTSIRHLIFLRLWVGLWLSIWYHNISLLYVSN